MVNTIPRRLVRMLLAAVFLSGLAAHAGAQYPPPPPKVWPTEIVTDHTSLTVTFEWEPTMVDGKPYPTYRVSGMCGANNTRPVDGQKPDGYGYITKASSPYRVKYV